MSTLNQKKCPGSLGRIQASGPKHRM
jgi:hypothetical protein